MAESIYKSEEGETLIRGFYSELLNEWPMKKDLRFIETRQGKTGVIVCGNEEKPPLLLLHGSSTNSGMWMGDIAAYAGHFRVYAVDIIGEPGLSDPSRPGFEGTAYADWLHDVCAALGLDRVSIAATSLGGWMAISFATRFPGMVERLVLICPSGLAPQKNSFILKAIPLMFLGDFGLERINRMVYYKFQPDERLKTFARLIAKHYNPRVVQLPVFSDEELKRLTMPVHYFGGDHDELLDTPKSIQRLNSLLPGARAHLVPETGHAITGIGSEILSALTAAG